jgi:hypothetical protein
VTDVDRDLLLRRRERRLGVYTRRELKSRGMSWRLCPSFSGLPIYRLFGLPVDDIKAEVHAHFCMAFFVITPYENIYSQFHRDLEQYGHATTERAVLHASRAILELLKEREAETARVLSSA